MEENQKVIAERQFRILWNSYIATRPGADKLLEWMEYEGFFTAPASARHHLNTPGGLCVHTMNVVFNALDLCTLPAFAEVDKREAIAAAMLHDLCKVGKYRREPDGSYRSCDNRLLGHGEESVIIASQFIRLSTAEMLAIRWHMGAYTGADQWNTLGSAYDRCPLAMLLHFADMMAAHHDEVG